MWVGPNKDKFQLHIELDRKAYWNLVQDAAEQEQHPEEYLEAYLNTMWQAANSEELWEASRSSRKAPLLCFRCQGSQRVF